MRRGQITLFIILSVVLLFLFAWAFSVVFAQQGAMPPDQQMVFDYVGECLGLVGEDALVVLGRSGRINHEASYEPLGVEYYYKDGVQRVLTREEAAVELARYVDDHMGACVNFTVFEGMNFNSIGVPSSSVVVDDDVVFTLDYPLKFSKRNVEYGLDAFIVTKELPLGEYIDVASDVVSYYDQHGAIDTMVMGPTVHVAWHNETLLVVQEDNNTVIESYLFAFAMS